MNELVHEGITYRWSGELTETSALLVEGAPDTTFGGLVAMTNGDALEWFQAFLG